MTKVSSDQSDPPPVTPLIILVRPQMGENIGATARAMLNFGLTGLRLVAPRDGWPNARATAMAAGASPVLDGVRLFDDVASAVADCQHVYATTVRQRGLFLPVHTPDVAMKTLSPLALEGQRTAILFGAEKSGLSTDEVAFADGILSIPVNPDFSSLNLAQAVVILGYAWSQVVEMGPVFSSPYDETPGSHGETEGAAGHLIEALDRAGYFFPPDKRPTQERNVRTLLSNAKFTSAELRLFRGMVRQLMNKLP